MMNNQFPASNKLIKREKAPQSIEVGEAFSKPEWITEYKRYWISRERHGYRIHSEKSEVGCGANNTAIRWHYTSNFSSNPWAKNLADAVKFVERHRQKKKQRHPALALI